MSAMSFDEEHEVGSASIRGVETTRYSMSENLDEMRDVLGVNDEEIAELESVVGEQLHIDFWLDEEGFVRRMEFPISMTPGGRSALARIELYDFDGNFDVEIPADSEMLPS